VYVGRCKPGEELNACTRGGNGYTNLDFKSKGCNANNEISIEITCKGQASTSSTDETAGNTGSTTDQRWVKGAVDSTCDTTCGAIGLMCDSDAQTELNTNEKVKAAFAEAGYTCKSFHAARSYAGAPFSTGRANDDCASFLAGDKKSVCDSNTPGNHAPLCSCLASTSSTDENAPSTINSGWDYKPMPDMNSLMCGWQDQAFGIWNNEYNIVIGDSLTAGAGPYTLQQCKEICAAHATCDAFSKEKDKEIGICWFKNHDAFATTKLHNHAEPESPWFTYQVKHCSNSGQTSTSFQECVGYRTVSELSESDMHCCTDIFPSKTKSCLSSLVNPSTGPCVGFTYPMRWWCKDD